MRRISIWIVAICMLLCFAQLQAVGRATWYTVEALPTEGDATSYAYAINNSGLVVGTMDGVAVVWEGGAVRKLPGLEGPYGEAYGVSNSGLAVGASPAVFIGQTEFHHACLWKDGIARDLGTLGGGLRSYARGVNDDGCVVGYSLGSIYSGDRAFAWQAGLMTELESLGGQGSRAFCINEQGTIGGEAADGSGRRSPVLWTASGIRALPSPKGRGSVWAVNRYGDAAGWVSQGDRNQFALWLSGQLIEITAGEGYGRWPYGINADEWVVGGYHTLGWARHGFLWAQGRLLDLNDALPPDSSWIVDEARGINDAGVIAAVGSRPGDSQHTHALVLRPAFSSVVLRVRSGEYPARIDLRSHGVVSVAVLSSRDVNAVQIDPATVWFAGARPVRWHREDVDRDRDTDMVFFFEIQQLRFALANPVAGLTAETYDGRAVYGKERLLLSPG